MREISRRSSHFLLAALEGESHPLLLSRCIGPILPSKRFLHVTWFRIASEIGGVASTLHFTWFCLRDRPSFDQVTMSCDIM
uniref:Ixodegrin n=1 Tax=Rhipicephalus appendiculatus TaxID=34631 RepID=A0A131YGF4_RHIAP